MIRRKRNLMVGAIFPLKYDNTLTTYGQSFPCLQRNWKGQEPVWINLYADIDTIEGIFLKALPRKRFSFTESVNPDCSISNVVMIRLKTVTRWMKLKQTSGVRLTDCNWSKKYAYNVADSLGVFAKMIILLEGVTVSICSCNTCSYIQLSVREKKKGVYSFANDGSFT